MNLHRLIQCAHRNPATGDDLTRLRALFRTVYATGDPNEHRFLVVASPDEVKGFDRVVVPLAYAKALTELTSAPIALPSPGLVVTLIDAHGPRLTTVVQRLRSAAPTPRPPNLRLTELPLTVTTALALLDEICD